MHFSILLHEISLKVTILNCIQLISFYTLLYPLKLGYHLYLSTKTAFVKLQIASTLLNSAVNVQYSLNLTCQQLFPEITPSSWKHFFTRSWRYSLSWIFFSLTGQLLLSLLCLFLLGNLFDPLSKTECSGLSHWCYSLLNLYLFPRSS